MVGPTKARSGTLGHPLSSVTAPPTVEFEVSPKVNYTPDLRTIPPPVALWSSSSQHLPKPRDSLTMAATSVLSTIKDLLNDDVFVEKTQDLSRLFYSNTDLTIDLYVYLAWGTAISAGLLLMFLLFGDESSSGYGSALSKSYDTDDAILELQQQVTYDQSHLELLWVKY